MRILTGGVSHVAGTVEADLADRETGLQKPHIKGLADVVACVLTCRNANTAEWQSRLLSKHKVMVEFPAQIRPKKRSVLIVHEYFEGEFNAKMIHQLQFRKRSSVLPRKV